MNEYTLEEFLDDLFRAHTPNGETLTIRPARPQRERTSQHVQRQGGAVLVQNRLSLTEGTNAGSGSLDRFDIFVDVTVHEAWWVPGLTRNQHQMYQTFRRDGMKVVQALETAQTLEELDTRV